MIDAEKKIKDLKKIILETAHNTREGHIPSAFSILDILYVLYDSVLNIDPKNPEKKDRDYLAVSKGHAAIGIYAVLAEFGFFCFDELKTFGRYNSRLGGHPDCNKVPGVEVSSGSLGHGFPMAVGIAFGLSFRESAQRVFAIVGDGELNEGSMWESIIFAGEHKLKNLVCIVDYNHSLDRSIKWGDSASFAAKFAEFGWDTKNVDGHNHEALREVLSARSDRPIAIIADTIKGKGCASMEKEPAAWHHRTPNEEELKNFVKELSI